MGSGSFLGRQNIVETEDYVPALHRKGGSSSKTSCTGRGEQALSNFQPVIKCLLTDDIVKMPDSRFLMSESNAISGQDAVSVEIVSQLDAIRLEWDEYVYGKLTGSVFHLTAWQRALYKTFAYPGSFCIARRNGRLCGLLPLYSVQHLPVGRSLVSAPFAVYGGICADDEQVERVLLDYGQNMAEKTQVRYLELRHEKPIGSLPVKDLYVTFRREIYGDEEKNLNAIPRKQRRMVRQGDKHGLKARVGGEELLDEFYAVYSSSVRNLGTPVFPRRWIEHLLDEFGAACRILGVFHEKTMVAGVMTFFFRDQVMPYYGGAYPWAFQYAANDFMYWKLLCYGAEHGFKVFDFGRSKKGTGPYDFKRHWGFEPTPLPYQYHLVTQKTLPNLNPTNPMLSLPIELWKRLPLPLSQWLGPKLIRFFP